VRSAILGSGAGVHTVGVADDRLKIPDGVEVDGLIELMTLQPGVKSLRTLAGCDHDLLVNAVGETKAGYVVTSSQRGRLPGLVLFLPYFPKKPAALHRLLHYLSERDPEMFPMRKAVPWHNENAYQSPAVRRVREERDRRTREHEGALAALEGQEADALEAQRALVPLFRATGDDLAEAASSALSSLGLQVVDADAARAVSGDPKREDFVVSDGADEEYIAVVEVTGGKGNVKQKDLTDLLLYRDAPQQQRPEVRVQALLIVNQMVEVEPALRDELFEHAQQNLKLAAAKGVTIISGWDLF
jgi:hypothetical protein